MSTFPSDEIDALKALCDGVAVGSEGGKHYLLLEGLRLPKACSPEKVDALLCPTERDGYSSRLFFAVQVVGAATLNWNGQNVRILERNWFAYSWKIRAGLPLPQMVDEHLAPLR